MSAKPEVGTVWKERDSRFTRYVMIFRIEGDKAVVRSSVYPRSGYRMRETRIAIKNFGKRYSFWGMIDTNTKEYEEYRKKVLDACCRLMGEEHREFWETCSWEEPFSETPPRDPEQVAIDEYDALTF